MKNIRFGGIILCMSDTLGTRRYERVYAAAVLDIGEGFGIG